MILQGTTTNNSGKKEKRFKLKSSIVFQFSIRESKITFASSNETIYQSVILYNKSTNVSYHISPGPFIPLRQMYDTNKSFQTVLVDVLNRY